jgi:hypothetical protein
MKVSTMPMYQCTMLMLELHDFQRQGRKVLVIVAQQQWLRPFRQNCLLNIENPTSALLASAYHTPQTMSL